jgi:GTP-binding protein EngB required for normal cell division
LDLQLREWLEFHGRASVTVATKTDKLSANELRKSLARTGQALGAAGGGASNIVAYSAVTGRGRESVWRAIEEAVAASKTPSS